MWLPPTRGGDEGAVTCEAVLDAIPTQVKRSRLWIPTPGVAWVTHMGGLHGYVGIWQLPRQSVTTDHYAVYLAT